MEDWKRAVGNTSDAYRVGNLHVLTVWDDQEPKWNSNTFVYMLSARELGEESKQYHWHVFAICKQRTKAENVAIKMGYKKTKVGKRKLGSRGPPPKTWNIGFFDVEKNITAICKYIQKSQTAAGDPIEHGSLRDWKDETSATDIKKKPKWATLSDQIDEGLSLQQIKDKDPGFYTQNIRTIKMNWIEVNNKRRKTHKTNLYIFQGAPGSGKNWAIEQFIKTYFPNEEIYPKTGSYDGWHDYEYEGVVVWNDFNWTDIQDHEVPSKFLPLFDWTPTKVRGMYIAPTFQSKAIIMSVTDARAPDKWWPAFRHVENKEGQKDQVTRRITQIFKEKEYTDMWPHPIEEDTLLPNLKEDILRRQYYGRTLTQLWKQDKINFRERNKILLYL